MCCSYWKGSVHVTLDFGRQLYLKRPIGLIGWVFTNGQETRVQSQVESYQRLKKWYLMSPCLTLSIIRYRSRVKWSNQGKELHPPLHLGVVAIEKGAFRSFSTSVANFSFTLHVQIGYIKNSWLGFMAHNPCMLFNANTFYRQIIYIW